MFNSEINPPTGGAAGPVSGAFGQAAMGAVLGVRDADLIKPPSQAGPGPGSQVAEEFALNPASPLASNKLAELKSGRAASTSTLPVSRGRPGLWAAGDIHHQPRGLGTRTRPQKRRRLDAVTRWAGRVRTVI